MNKKGISGEAIAGLTIVAFILLLVYALLSFSYVGAGHVGVKNRLGTVDPVELQPGAYWVGVLTHVESFDTRVQLREYKASAASQDLQTVSTNIALNYRIDPQRTPEIYKTIGTEYADIIITPIVQEGVKASTAHYIAGDLIKNREQAKKEITDMLTNRLKDSGIIVTQVSLTDFQFSADFEKAIEDKQVAAQNALTAENNLKAMQFNAQSMELQNKVIEIKKLDIQQKWIDKWNGVLPTQLLSTSGTTDMLLSLPTITAPATK